MSKSAFKKLNIKKGGELSECLQAHLCHYLPSTLTLSVFVTHSELQIPRHITPDQPEAAYPHFYQTAVFHSLLEKCHLVFLRIVILYSSAALFS